MIVLFFCLWGLLVAAFLGAYPFFRLPLQKSDSESVAGLSMVTAALARIKELTSPL